MQEVTREEQGLYRQEFEHDNCGIGAVVNIKGKKTHETVANALRIVEHLEHRAGKDAEGKTGDGVGILLQISHKFFKKACKKEGFDIGEEREYGIAQFFFPQHEIKRAQAKNVRDHRGKRRTGASRMEKRSCDPGGPRTQGKRVHAMHHAGIYQKTTGCRKGSPIRSYALHRTS